MIKLRYMNTSKKHSWDDIIFIPWIGKQYFNGGIFEKRILALGDSHYCRDCENCSACGVLGSTPQEMGNCRNLTCNTVKSFLDEESGFEGWKNTFKRFSGVMAGGHKTTNEEDRQIWDSISFYNFVQTAMQSGPRSPYSEEAYKKSLSMFWNVLDNLSPDLVIVWGEKAWNELPSDGWEWVDIGIKEDIAAGRYNDGKSNALFLLIRHPSAALGYDIWPSIINRAIEFA